MTDAELLAADRRFGYLAAVLATATGAYLFFTGAPGARAGAAAAIGLCFLATAVGRPRWLRPLHRAWMRLGDWMSKVVNPLVLGAIFFLLLTPVALLAKLSRRDPLRLRNRRHLRSYWVEREPSGPDPESFRNQF